MTNQEPRPRFDYQRYLASREWALLKRQVRERSGGNCERCKVGKYEDTHHLTYERVGHEDMADLQAVCRNCHAYLSGQSDYDPCWLYSCFMFLEMAQERCPDLSWDECFELAQLYVKEVGIKWPVPVS